MQFDTAIIGGGVAGLQAALTLARGNRRVLVVDAGQPRHRFANHMHNFLGADGFSPADFYGRMHDELALYPHVTRVNAQVNDVQRSGDGFVLSGASGARYEARTVLFATGVKDELPPIPGIAELWGSRVLHCTYCHGYEVRDKTLGAVTTSDKAVALAGMLRALTPRLHLFLEGNLPDAALSAQLQAMGAVLELRAIDAVAAHNEGVNVRLSDGRDIYLDALFIHPGTSQVSALPQALGCQLQNGDFIATNGYGATHAPGVFAAGDAIGGVPQLMVAASSGLLAAMSINLALG